MTTVRPFGCVLIAIALASCATSQAGAAGNYLVIVAEAFDGTPPMTDFISARTAHGFNVLTYAVAPDTSNTQIKSYIQSLWGTGDAPDYILIVGDTPAVPHWAGGGSKHAATDLPYACMDGAGDWYPDIAIGRFSVSDVSELQAVVDKTLFVEAGVFSDPGYVTRGAFLANASTYGTAEPTHDWVIDTYFTPNEYEGIKIYAAQGGNTQDVTDAVNGGCLFAVYFGHSGSGGWSSPGFGQNDVRALSNEGLYGLVFGFSCNTANYPMDECFGETWIRVADKGAAAYISASTYIYWGSVEAWEPSVVLEKAYFSSFFEYDIWEIGPAWQSALYRFLTEYGEWNGDPQSPPSQNEDVCRNFFEEFVLLGDPALRLPQPWGFWLAAEPMSQDLCCPPDTEAVYTVHVEPSGGFDEAVTLEVTGEPAGASVAFSVNSVAPPFTTEVTIGGLNVGSVGEYVLEISGTALTFDRSTSVELNIAADVPADAGLVSPYNGEIDVLRNPELVWLPAAGALDYHLEVATDPGFANVVYATTVSGTNHALSAYLDELTLHYWHVEALNGCGSSGFSPAFGFTTAEQIEHFTEIFGQDLGAFDIEGLTFGFVPDGSSDFYSACAVAAAALPTNPSGGTALLLPDDGSEAIVPTQPVWLYGSSYDTVFVNSNGNITFGSGDSTYTESLAAHFSQPRISCVFDDLNPASAGTVSWEEKPNRVVVTYDAVPEYGTNNSNTFQIELFFSGAIHVTWLEIGCGDGIAGLSAGGGLPGGYLESDLSQVGDCNWPWFDIDVTPHSQDVCAPFNAVYDVSLESMLGFDEPVTLVAEGAPQGTVVTFSVNGIAPPFQSTMTVHNTKMASPGQYQIAVTGTATGGMEKTGAVTLRLSTALPSAVLLSSPPDGQLDVPRAPTFMWEPASQALQYLLEVAIDEAFETVVYEATVDQTSHTVEANLSVEQTYYWRVRAGNGCGDAAPSAPFNFTTLVEADYFSEQFTSGFDLSNRTIMFVPDGSANHYDACIQDAGELPTDPGGGIILPLSDDSFGEVLLVDGRTVEFYGVTYDHFFVGSNGYVTFTSGDSDYTETFGDHFAQPRISALFDDLNPGAGGTVSSAQLEDRVAVTFDNVPEYGTGNSNTLQIELLFDGEVHITWLGIDSADSIAGLSAGEGVPQDFEETDLSASLPCAGSAQPCLIISEVVYGAESGGHPRWIEITNTGLVDFTFAEGGLIVQRDGSGDVDVDIDLSGVTIAAGQSFVINSTHDGGTGAFRVVYGFHADMYTDVPLGDGNDVYIVTDSEDGSNLIDIYGEFGVNGTGEPWEYTLGFSYRRPAYNSGSGGAFAPREWLFGGVNSLAEGNPTKLLWAYTTPAVHEYYRDCPSGLLGDIDEDGDVDIADFHTFTECLAGPNVTTPPPGCDPHDFANADLDDDADVDVADLRLFQIAFTEGTGLHNSCKP